MISIRILKSIGPAYAQHWITRFGFDADKHPAYLPMALGAGSVTPLQMATAYSVFANGGYRVNPMLISRVTDAGAAFSNEAQAVDARRVDAHDRRAQRLRDDEPAAGGHAHRAPRRRAQARSKRPDIYGKTGTTNDSIDAWFAGWQQNVVAVVWMGYDNPRKLGDRETGGGLALPVWIDYMETMLKGVPVQEPTPPDGVVNLGGEWYYEEYARGTGVSSLGLEDKAAPRRRATRSARASSICSGAEARPAPLSGVEAQRPCRPGRWHTPTARRRTRDRRAVDPAAADRAEMKAPGVRREPQLLQRRLGVDDDLAAVRKGELEQAAGAAGVDVDDVVLQEAIGRRLDRREHLSRPRFVVGVGERVGWGGDGAHGR